MNIVCEVCGETNGPGVTFCLFCGTFLNWDQTAGEAQTAGRPSNGGADRHSNPPAAEGQRPDRLAEKTLVLPPVDTAPTTPVPPAPLNQTSCPDCGRANDSTRRFCAKCGYQLVGAPRAEGHAAPKSALRRWWERLRNTEDRAARRAYRRSLPLLYRWRRVGIVLVLTSLVVGGGVVTNKHPVAWARDRWSDVFYAKRVVDVGVSTVVINPAKASVKGSDPLLLVDNTADAWSMKWNAKTAARQCRAGTTAIELTFPPTRVRQIVIIPGLQDPKERLTEFRPSEVMYAFEDSDPCDGKTYPIDKDAFQEFTIETDSRTPVTKVRIVITAALSPEGEETHKRLSVAEIRIRQREK